MVRFYGRGTSRDAWLIAVSAAIVNLVLLIGLLATFQIIVHFAMFTLIVIIALTSSVPLIIVWRLSTIPLDHGGKHGVSARGVDRSQ
jgi:hypothetical protein